MSERPIIIRRKKAAKHGHHGGAWKIAFADFMTALMALFLVLWVLSNASKNDKEAIADYFSTPLLVAISKGERSANSASAIPGGGPDPRSVEGEKQRHTPRLSGEERRHLESLKHRLDAAVDRDPQLRELKQQIAIELSPEGLAEFHARLRAVMDGLGGAWEVVYVNDGSADATLARLEALRSPLLIATRSGVLK